MLQDFDSELDVARTNRLVVKTEVPSITDTIEVEINHAPPRARREERRSYFDVPDEEWTWENLRDYVVHEIEQRFGMFPRGYAEIGIFKRFVATWGAQSAAIARYVFEIENGWWLNRPVTITRFCIKSDKFFARPISQKLLDARRPG